MLALHAEHKQRTGHDAFTRNFTHVAACDVCLFLDAEKRDMDKSEAAYYESLAQQEEPLTSVS